MTIHVLVEGPSERALLGPWIKRLLPDADVRVHPHAWKGKIPSDLDAAPDPKQRGLLDQLPAKLRGFASAKATHHVLVLVDADDEDCKQLKANIVKIAQRCAPLLDVTVRIAVEETEAFYLGDLRAIKAAFPDADTSVLEKVKYTPDQVCGAWELFGKVIHDGGENKVAWATAMAEHLTIKPAESRSPSFKALLGALKKLARAETAAAEAARPKRRPYYHRAKSKTGATRKRRT